MYFIINVVAQFVDVFR